MRCLCACVRAQPHLQANVSKNRARRKHNTQYNLNRTKPPQTSKTEPSSSTTSTNPNSGARQAELRLQRRDALLGGRPRQGRPALQHRAGHDARVAAAHVCRRRAHRVPQVQVHGPAAVGVGHVPRVRCARALFSRLAHLRVWRAFAFGALFCFGGSSFACRSPAAPSYFTEP